MGCCPSEAADPEPALREVVVVDDDDDVRHLLGELLEWGGYRVHAAASGAEALDVMARLSAPPRLAIVDLVMPGMSGFDLIRRMRQTPSLAATSILAFTGMARDQITEAPAVDGWLHKPLAVDDLLRVVDGLTRRG
jgi:CheY-like chemotaxis protein